MLIVCLCICLLVVFMENLVISNLQVLKSAAGFYIGRTCQEKLPSGKPDGFIQHYSRESVEYWPEFSQAQEAFETGKYTPRTNL